MKKQMTFEKLIDEVEKLIDEVFALINRLAAAGRLDEAETGLLAVKAALAAIERREVR